MNNPFFSIITVCLNAGVELHNTINTILCQNFKNFEIIIKDGGSDDGSLDLLPKDNRIRVYIERDNGIYDAMNQALRFSTGNYILFLNAADYFYDTEVLSSYYDTIIANTNPMLVYSDYITTNLCVCVKSPKRVSNYFLFRTMLCHQTCMINRNVFPLIGYFNIDLKVVADYDFLLRMILINKLSSVYMSKISIISESSGYSSQNQELAEKEVIFLRKLYFKNRFILYDIINKITLPKVRKKIIQNRGFLAKNYQALVNFINKS